jgi:hypothetical protein
MGTRTDRFQLLLASLAGALALASGCGAEQPLDSTARTSAETDAPATPEESAEIGLILEADGLSYFASDAGKVGTMEFGTTMTVVEATLAAAGDPTAPGEICVDGITRTARLANGLAVYERDGLLVGWKLEDPFGANYASITGVTLGVDVDELKGAFYVDVSGLTFASTPGTGQLAGELAETSVGTVVQTLTAGQTCLAS